MARIMPKSRTGRIVLAAVLAVMAAGIVYGYLRLTYYPPLHIDPRVTFTGPPDGFYYTYVPGTVSKYPHKDAQGFSVVILDGTPYRQPVTHCNAALRVYHQYLESNDPSLREAFLKAADVLVDGAVKVTLGGRDALVWQYGFESKWHAPHQVPWLSAMAQGEAMSVLVRAHLMTGDKRYIHAAALAMVPFEFDVSDGGVANRDAKGHVFYEEYAFPEHRNHVLNGFITSLFGLYDYYRTTQDPAALDLFNAGADTLRSREVLEAYDLGYWTRYDLGPVVAPCGKYNALHAVQLEVLCRITGDGIFREMADKWRRYNVEHRYRVPFFFHSAWRTIVNYDKFL